MEKYIQGVSNTKEVCAPLKLEKETDFYFITLPENPEEKKARFESTPVRHEFIRKLYIILMAKLMIISGIISPFAFLDGLIDWVQKYSWQSVGFGILIIVIYNVVIVLCKNARRKFPFNIYLLLAGNLSEGILFGIVSSYFGTFSILLGAGIALLVCFIIVAFRLQTRFDFDGLGTSLFQGLAVLVLFALAGTFLNGIFPIVHVCFACLGTLLYLCRFVDAIQSIVSCTHKIPVSPDDYVLASLVIFSAAGF